MMLLLFVRLSLLNHNVAFSILKLISFQKAVMAILALASAMLTVQWINCLVSCVSYYITIITTPDAKKTVISLYPSLHYISPIVENLRVINCFIYFFFFHLIQVGIRTVMAFMPTTADAIMVRIMELPMVLHLVLEMLLAVASISTAKAPSLRRMAYILALLSRISSWIPLSTLVLACVLLANTSESILVQRFSNLILCNI